MAQGALNPGDDFGGVQAVDEGNLPEPGQQRRKARGHFAVERLQIADDGRESEKAEGREGAGHNEQKEKDGRGAVEWMPPANAQPRRGAHHRRKHDGEERGNIEQDQNTAQQPRDVDGEGKSEGKDDVAANTLRGAWRGLIHTRRSLHVNY